MKRIYYTILTWIKGETHLIEQCSKDALSSFQITLNNLKEVETRIQVVSNKKQNKANKLIQEVYQLNAIKQSNAKIANKLISFLND